MSNNTNSRKKKIFKNTLSVINHKLLILKNAIILLMGIYFLLLVWLIYLTFVYINQYETIVL